MPNVEIEVPYIYEVTYVPPRKRTATRATLAGKMAVTIESVDSEEAPLVVSWTQDDFEKTKTGHARAYRDWFYIREGRKDVTPETVNPGDIHDYDRHDLARYLDGNIPAAVEGRLETVLGHYDHERGMRAIEALREQIRRSAEECIFIDGLLYRRGPLPSVIATIDYRFSGNDVIDIRIGESNERTGAHGMQFGLGDIESAVAWAEERKEMEGMADVRCRVAVNVHAPDLIPTGTTLAGEAVRIGRFLMANGWKLEELSDESIMRWMDCRRTIVAAEADQSEDNVTAMLEAWEAFYAAYEADETARRRSYGSSYSAKDDIYYKALAGVRSQWEARPIAGHEAGPAMRPSR